MRKILLLAMLGAVGGLAGCSDSSAEVVVSAAPAPDERPRTAERLVAIVDYVASDYGGAVKDGAVVDPAEYEEQIGMVASVRKLAEELPAIPPADLAALDAAVRAKAPATDIAGRCAKVRATAVDAYAIATAPALPPSFARGQEIFRQSCVQCHGPDGRGDGKEGIALEPAPANLRDPERMAAVTPYRAYCDVTYGIAGTAMPALTLPASDRWSVAFYACALQHLEAGATPAGTAEGAARPAAVRLGLATLASKTDEELEALLAPTIPDLSERRHELARLRAVAPFQPEAGEMPMAFARRKLAEAEAAAVAGARAEADRLVLDAYIGGIEEIEAPLRARDAALVASIEDRFAGLRASIASGTTPEVQDRVAEVVALLDRAERTTDERPSSAGLLAFAAALIILREGLEAALIVAAILAVVRRVGLPATAARAVHGGWIAALVAGGLTFVVARTLVARLVASREVLEAAVALLAAAVLFATSFWLISKADAQRWMAYVKARAAGSAAKGGAAGLFAVAFLATYREAFESVLFFEALLGGSAARAAPLVLGALIGAGMLGAAVYVIGRLERRLPIGPFFAASGGLLSVLAVVLLGHGVHALQASSFLLPRPVAFARIEWLGVYPDAISLGAQAAMLAAIVLGALAMRLGRRTETAPAS